MTFQNDLDRERRRKSDNGSSDPADPAPRPQRKKGHTTEYGDALRTVYQRTIEEDIPPEMLDLLGKLG